MWWLELALTPTCCLFETTPIDRLYFHVSGVRDQARVCSRVHELREGQERESLFEHLPLDFYNDSD